MYSVYVTSGDFQNKLLFMGFEAFPSPVSAYWDSVGFLFCLKFHLKTYISMEHGGVEPVPGFSALRMCLATGNAFWRGSARDSDGGMWPAELQKAVG